MKTIIISCLLMLFFYQCTQKKAIHITELSQMDIKKSTLIDVRTPEEYQEGHVKSAININWYDPEFERKVSKLGSTNTIYVYCKKGSRSAKATQLLDSLGYPVIDLLGGYDAYMANASP